MKPVLALTLLLTAFSRLCAQTPQHLARDMQANASSIAAIRNVIAKHAANKDTRIHWAYYNDTIGFFRQKKLFQSFTYRVPSGKDSMTRTVNLFVTYTNDQVRYIKLESFHYEFSGGLTGIQRPVYYTDTVYTDSLLSTYNAKHKTCFTYGDLYEDECDCFCVIPKGGYKIKPGGEGIDSVEISYQFGEFWVMIKDRDHAAIVKNCRSFNTNRKAFAAFCLYVLQQRGEPLSWEEKELMQKILNSNETINYRAVSKRSNGEHIKDVLTPQTLKIMYSHLYGGK